jgi:hypothetical protein
MIFDAGASKIFPAPHSFAGQEWKPSAGGNWLAKPPALLGMPSGPPEMSDTPFDAA